MNSTGGIDLNPEELDGEADKEVYDQFGGEQTDPDIFIRSTDEYKQIATNQKVLEGNPKELSDEDMAREYRLAKSARLI